MNNLENQARPALAALVKGTPRSLSQAEQQALAAWGMKVMMLAPFLSSKHSPVPRAQYEGFYRTQVPPPLSAMWIAAYDAGKEAGATFTAFR